MRRVQRKIHDISNELWMTHKKANHISESKKKEMCKLALNLYSLCR